MKKFLFLLCAAFAILGCSSDDDNKDNNSPSEKIVGTWKITSMTVADFVLPLSNCELKEEIIFKANHKFNELHNDETTSCNIIDDNFLGTWSRAGENYEISANDEASFAFINDAESIAADFSNENQSLLLTLQMSAETSTSGNPYVITLTFDKVPENTTNNF